MQKPPSSHNPVVIGNDIRESFEKWSKLEVVRVMAKYKLDERVATSAVASTVLGSSVATLKMIGTTVSRIISLIKGQEAS